MENAATGRVVVAAKIENLSDEWLAATAGRESHEIRTLDVPDAIVDKRLTRLSLSRRLIERLGLMRLDASDAEAADRIDRTPIYGPARLTVQGRYCIVEVVELCDDRHVVIGHVPLTLMDWVVDLKDQKLIGNSKHDGEWISDMFLAAGERE